jgi:hypothetical protein
MTNSRTNEKLPVENEVLTNLPIIEDIYGEFLNRHTVYQNMHMLILEFAL